MTDTETRLRDYLQATANTVPDDAESPGLDELSTPAAATSGRSSWQPPPSSPSSP